MASTGEERAMGKQENLAELLVRRALIKPESTAYIWLQDGEKESDMMAAAHIAAIKTVQPQGPYRVGGWSWGGPIAFEMA